MVQWGKNYLNNPKNKHIFVDGRLWLFCTGKLATSIRFYPNTKVLLWKKGDYKGTKMEFIDVLIEPVECLKYLGSQSKYCSGWLFSYRKKQLEQRGNIVDFIEICFKHIIYHRIVTVSKFHGNSLIKYYRFLKKIS